MNCGIIQTVDGSVSIAILIEMDKYIKQNEMAEHHLFGCICLLVQICSCIFGWIRQRKMDHLHSWGKLKNQFAFGSRVCITHFSDRIE